VKYCLLFLSAHIVSIALIATDCQFTKTDLSQIGESMWQNWVKLCVAKCTTYWYTSYTGKTPTYRNLIQLIQYKHNCTTIYIYMYVYTQFSFPDL